MTIAKLPRFLLCVLLLAAAAGCGGGKGDAPAAGAQAETRGGGAGGQPEEPPVPVAVASAELGSISSYYKATATLEAEKEAQVLARVAGVIAALSAEEGDRVGAGAALLRIDNNEYRLRADQAAASTANLRARFQRLQAMRAEDLATDEEFEAARSELARAEADEGLARLNLSYTEVVAPFGGRVTRRLVSVGQNVSAGTPLFALADFDPLLAKVHVPSREFNKLRRDQDVELVLDSVGQRVQGRITLISPVIDPASGTIKITIEIPSYPEGTRPGDFAQVQIVTERRDGAVLVPRSAVLTDKGETVVYVAAGEGGATAERRVVETGFTDDDRTQILTGLAAAERVVIKGQRSLKHGSKLKILDEQAGS
ncbi:MAG: efflux RND transporter periplasmic adaptor subunit [bacterium]|nr:efflux RND transporter periplasmic adaptor subunit [bacterium]